MPYKFVEIKRRLEKIGFEMLRQKGSHVIFGNGKTTIPVPKHGGKEISAGVEKNILNAIGLKREEFDDIC